MADLDKLKNHLQLARTIIDERGLYTIWEHVPKGGDPDFEGNSFNEAVRQGINFKTYDDWTATLEDLFFTNKLDYLKFKGLTLTRDGRKSSKLPAAIFMRKVKELERMFEEPSVMESYKTASKQAASWPPVAIKDSVVSQGARSHKFSEPVYPRLISKLWKNRRIETPSGIEIVKGKPAKRSILNKSVGIKDHQRFVDVTTGIRKAMKSKGIDLNVMYPDDVILVVRQNRL